MSFMINNQLLKDVIGLDVDQVIECNHIGLSDTTLPNSLAFLDDTHYLDELNSNSNINVVLTTQSLSESVHGKYALVREDPRIDFFTLYNHLAESAYRKTPSVIHETARIHPRAYVADYNVEIGANTVVEANASILADVRIGENVIIRAGAVIGCEGFEPKRGRDHILSVFHDGKVLIGDGVEIGANACVCKGVYAKSTCVGRYTKTGCMVNISHNVQIGRCCLIASTTTISGSVTIGDNVWIGPNATITHRVRIGDESFIALGSVLTVDLGDKATHLARAEGIVASENNDTIANRIRKVFQRVFPYESHYSSRSSPSNTVGWDSVGNLNFILALESEFKQEIPLELANGKSSVEQLILYFEEKAVEETDKKDNRP